MGALLALPELLSAFAVAGGEAVEISGGLGALLAGGGLEALEGLEAAAAVAGLEGIGATEEALYLLGAVPAAVQQATLLQAGLSSLIGTAVLYSHQTGHQLLQTQRHSGRFGPEAMALQLWLPQFPGDFGIERLPEWLYAAAREAPEVLANLLRDIATGIWRSYYNTGRALIRRSAAEQLAAALNFLRSRFYQEVRPLLERAQEDPVGQIVDVLNFAREFGRDREAAMLIQGRPIFDLYGNRDLVVWDANNLPIEGYSDQASGFHEGGRWITLPGAGTAGENTLPQWMLYVLGELEKEISFLTRNKYVLQKEGESKWNRDTGNSNKKRRR